MERVNMYTHPIPSVGVDSVYIYNINYIYIPTYMILDLFGLIIIDGDISIVFAKRAAMPVGCVGE